MNSNESLVDLKKITSKLIEMGLSVDQNFPSFKKVGNQELIGYGNYSDTSIALKNISYHEIYKVLEEERQFNIKLLDGGLLQFFYCYEKGKLLKHRLCYFPSPTFESFQTDPELYLDESLIYADILSKSVLPIPIRFDYSPNDFIEIEHPTSHLTLGQYKNCRIPVESALCPSTFTNFILRSFYLNGIIGKGCVFKRRRLDTSITELERDMLYVSV